MNRFDEVLQNVLSGSKYDFLTGRKMSFGERLLKLFYDFIEFIFSKLNLNFDFNFGSINSSALKNIFLIIAAAVIIVAASIIINLILKRRKRKSLFDDIFSDFSSNTLTLSELMEYAEKSGNNGDYPLALRYRYIALIKVFSENNIVYVTDSMTGGQFRRAVMSNAPEFVYGVDMTVDLFYKLWFGKKTITSEEFNSHTAVFDNIIREAQNFEQKI